METLFEFGLNATQWLQSNYPSFETVMQSAVFFGRFEFYAALMLLLYWSINKRMGAHFIYLLIVSLVVNAFLKAGFRAPRPYWLDPDGKQIQIMSEEASFGNPSGHVQTTTIVVFFFAAWIHRWWGWLLAAFLIMLIALSRIYLGVHFVHDAFAGFIVGVLIITGYWISQRYFAERFRNRILGQRLLIAIAVPLAVAALYVVLILLLGKPDVSVRWGDFVQLAVEASNKDMVTGIALLIAVGIGFTLERSRVCFDSGGLLWKRLLRYALGLPLTLVLWYGMSGIIDAVTPDGTLWLKLPLRFAEYFLLGLWMSYWVPMLFVKLQLANSGDEPELPFTVKGASMREGKERKRR
jgi:membrane-associated phospholipid phosphatase